MGPFPMHQARCNPNSFERRHPWEPGIRQSGCLSLFHGLSILPAQSIVFCSERILIIYAKSLCSKSLYVRLFLIFTPSTNLPTSPDLLVPNQLPVPINTSLHSPTSFPALPPTAARKLLQHLRPFQFSLMFCQCGQPVCFRRCFGCLLGFPFRSVLTLTFRLFGGSG